MIELTLPWPPSINKYYRVFQNRIIISKEGRDYRKAIIAQVIEQKADYLLKGKLKVTLECHRPDNRRRDLDNVQKASLDSLTHAKVWEDDSQIVDLHTYWSPHIGGHIKVTIEEL
jgi:crossover junction endodeoxyribonuclease RusA